MAWRLALALFALPLLAAECAGGPGSASGGGAAPEQAPRPPDTAAADTVATDTAARTPTNTTAPGATLGAEQTAKLDPALKKLLGVPGAAQGLFQYRTTKRASGATAYAVVLQTNASRAALREAGVPVTTVTPTGVATAHLTPAEIASATRLEAVASVRHSAARAPSGSPPRPR